MNRIFIIVFFFLFLLNISYSQINVPENVYGIKNPLKDFNKKCSTCMNTLKSFPPEVRFGTQIHDGVIYFVITDENWYNKLFEKSGDGIAIDIIDRKMYACDQKKAPQKSWAYRGALLKPMYLKEMNENAESGENGEVFIKVGILPIGFDENNIECNLLILKDKNLCQYNNFYDLRGEKWKLLEMGLFMDTISQESIKEKSALLNKQWRFEIPFEKNKYEYAEADVKPIYDSLKLNDYYIKSIHIRAYSSVEGPLDNNIKLQEKRAESIVKALQSFQVDTISANISASENWVEFLDDIAGSKYSYLKTLSKDEIKAKLENKQFSQELEPYLKKERKGILQIELEKKIKVLENDPEKVKKMFDKTITEKSIKEALEIQQIIFSKIRNNHLPSNFLKGVEIPEQIDYGMLLNNNAAFNYQQNDSNLYSSLKQFHKLHEIIPGNAQIQYNICALELKSWIRGELLIEPSKLKEDIMNLEKMKIEKTLIKRLLINYHIILSEYMMKKRNYLEKDKAVKYIYNNYNSLTLSDQDVLSLAQYFVAYHKYDWAETLLGIHAKKIDVDENLLFYYLNLTIVKPKITSTQAYRTIMLNAINMNRERFCKLFDPFGKGGISFQLLDNEFLKKTYCENCNK